MNDKILVKMLEPIFKEIGYETDNYGQVLIYTGLYEWEDGTFHAEPEPEQKTNER